MPCDCSYMEPTSLEKELQRTAKLIVFVESHFKGITPRWIIEESNNIYANRKDLVPYLCDLLQNMSESNQNRIIYNARDKISRDLADWWDTHKEADRQRIRKEVEEDSKRKLKKSAMSKLTHAEKVALGIKD